MTRSACIQHPWKTIESQLLDSSLVQRRFRDFLLRFFNVFSGRIHSMIGRIWRLLRRRRGRCVLDFVANRPQCVHVTSQIGTQIVQIVLRRRCLPSDFRLLTGWKWKTVKFAETFILSYTITTARPVARPNACATSGNCRGPISHATPTDARTKGKILIVGVRKTNLFQIQIIKLCSYSYFY